MKVRMLGLVLLGLAAAGFFVVFRHGAPAQPAESTWWELLLALICVPAAVVGAPLLAFGTALFPRTAAPHRRKSFWDES